MIRNLTLFTEEPDVAYPSQDVVWEKFEKAFMVAAGLICHAPVLKDYLYKGLEELHSDNVMYLELRSGVSRVCVQPVYIQYSVVCVCVCVCMRACKDK